jgi:superfamily I DNA and RNA helicase
MTLDIVQGTSRNSAAARALADRLKGVASSGTMYLGYPVLATADERVEIDALLVTPEHGLCAFLFADGIPDAGTWPRVVSAQDRLFAVLDSYLRRHEALRRGRQLVVTPATATIFSDAVEPPAEADGYYGDMTGAVEFVRGLPHISEETERNLQAALQRVSTIKPAKKRVGVGQSGSRGSVLKDIERGIANLDRWQKAAAIETPEGPQRIRGLAGSGKTVVLALKAAYWHTQDPDWRIVVTFHTRALYQQLADLVTRFTFEHSNDLPDFSKLQIIHSWGSASRPGVYSLIAMALGQQPINWADARAKYGMDGAFQGVCRELLDIAKKHSVTPIFDGVLVDEAQDLPPEFFQLIYLFTKQPKRIVWGYDELQRLSEAAMPTTDELFGLGPSRESLVSLDAAADSPRRDIVLPVCYRNTPWALASAHALGIGVYRATGLLQHPDEATVWRDIGYEVVHGHLVGGETVTLSRRLDSSPPYFRDRISIADAVMVMHFENEYEQDVWVADQIQVNLTVDELEPDDILIVLPDTYRAKSRAPHLIRQLRDRGIDSHLVGVNTSVDEVFRPGSVAIAHIYRAKGNEAPMVYAVDAQYAAASFNAVTRRNTLFTAITRSRAWVRVTGYGPLMQAIAAEMQQVIDHQFQLRFRVPTQPELLRMRHIHRDRSPADEVSATKAAEALAAFLSAMDKGGLEFQDLPPDMLTRLASMQVDNQDDAE